MRDPDRNIAPAVKAAVLQRDGYRCRYCGIPVVHSDIRKQAHRLYPDAVPWDSYDPAKEHAAFACLWLQFDHVVPHSHGGRSSVENVVVSCALCNYGKDKYTLKQLGVADPRLTPPTSAAWDGLERFRAQLPKVADGERARVSDAALSNASIDAVARIAPSQNLQSFFFPWSRFSRGYLYTPPIAGKERWFKIDGDLKCESASRQGVPGYVLTCNATVLRRRGIDPNVFVDPGE
jgi:5-methylcytosine-specific restriction endonuclease McrA